MGKNTPTRFTDDDEQVGPKMYAALKLVAHRGSYPSMNDLATDVGPHGSARYGYEIINRCKSKGLLELDKEHPDRTLHGRGAVVVTDKGRRFLDQHSND